MKKIAFTLFALSFAASAALAALPGTDNAADPAYADGWMTGDNGGTLGSFSLWNLTSNDDGSTNFAGFFIGDSTSGAGDINTSGVSFGMYANPGDAFANAARDFLAPLSVGQTFSIDISANFRNGNKGLNLESSGGQIFNFNVGGDDYSINGMSIGAAYNSAAIFNLSFTQTSLTEGTYSVTFDGNTYSDLYSGIASGFQLYNSGTDGGDAANNLYFNNLAIIPEPSSAALLAGPLLLGAWFFLRRRRTA